MNRLRRSSSTTANGRSDAPHSAPRVSRIDGLGTLEEVRERVFAALKRG